MTEKKQLEAQILRAQRLESLGRLASGIAHDFNNILTPILGASQLLPVLSSQKDESIQKLLTSIETNAKRGTELIKQLLSFARGIEVQKNPISLVQLFSELETTLKSVFPKSIEIIIDYPTNLWTILADSTQLYQVILNICINARDAMPNGGIITIRGKNFYIDESYQKMYLEAGVGPYIVVTFSDTGVGMTPEVQEQIFDPFFTTKAVGRGSGLGLATVMGIVKNHGGFITVSSQVNKGTQFQVFLPAIDVEKTATLADLKDLKGQKELILVVDDDAPIQDITRKTLEVYNYQVMTAKDGIEAIAIYAQYQEKIKAVLMDLIMPTMDGFSAIRALQKLNPQVKVIAISGLESYSQSLNKDGIKSFLSKPYTTQELLGTLRFILDSTYNTIN